MEQQLKDRIEIREAVYRFLDEAYEQYLFLGEVDLSDVLDMSSEDCVLMQEEIRIAILEKKEELDNHPGVSEPRKMPIRISELNFAYSEGDCIHDDTKFGVFIVDLLPTAERSEKTYTAHMKQYPAFLTFGLNRFDLHIVDGKWKIYSINHTPKELQNVCQSTTYYLQMIRRFYEKAWEQYTKLEYTGFHGIIAEDTPAFQEAEALLKTAIEERKMEQDQNPGMELPKKMGYEIHLVDRITRPVDHNLDIYYSTVSFVLVPTEDFKEGTDGEIHKPQYPAFMNFEDNCFLFHQLGELGEDRYIIEDLDPEVIEYSIAE